MDATCRAVSYLSLSDAHCQLFHRLIQGHLFFLLQLSPESFYLLDVIINVTFNLLCMGGKEASSLLTHTTDSSEPTHTASKVPVDKHHHYPQGLTYLLGQLCHTRSDKLPYNCADKYMQFIYCVRSDLSKLILGCKSISKQAMLSMVKLISSSKSGNL